ncbi:MAG: hypothetical protein Kow0080_06540 [Candidatus Promineifilaceae bacterium]
MNAKMNKGVTGGAFLMGAGLLVSVVNYALSIVLSWTLTPDDYGRIGVSQGFIFLGVWFLVEGFPRVAARTLSRVDEDGVTAVYPIIKGALLGNLLLGLVIAGGLEVAYSAGILRLDGSYRLLLLWVSLTILFLAVRMPFDAALQGRFRFGKLGVVRLVEVVLQFGTAVYLVRRGYGANGALAGFAIGTGLSMLFSIWLARDVPFLQARGWPAAEIIQALRPVLPFLIANLGGVLMLNVDLLAVKFLVPPEQSDLISGYYQVTAVLARIPYFIAQILLLMVFPAVSRASKQPAEANEIARQGIQLILFGVLAINIILFAAPEAVIRFFFAPDYLVAANALRWQAVAVSFIITAIALAIISQAQDETFWPAVALPAGFVVQMAVAVWAIPRFLMMGAPVASGLAGLTALALMGQAVWRRFPGMLAISWQAVAKGLALLGLLLACFVVMPPGGRPFTVVWGLVSVALYGTAVYKSGLIKPAFVLALFAGEKVEQEDALARETAMADPQPTT